MKLDHVTAVSCWSVMTINRDNGSENGVQTTKFYVVISDDNVLSNGGH